MQEPEPTGITWAIIYWLISDWYVVLSSITIIHLPLLSALIVQLIKLRGTRQKPRPATINSGATLQSLTGRSRETLTSEQEGTLSRPAIRDFGVCSVRSARGAACVALRGLGLALSSQLQSKASVTISIWASVKNESAFQRRRSWPHTMRLSVNQCRAQRHARKE